MSGVTAYVFSTRVSETTSSSATEVRIVLEILDADEELKQYIWHEKYTICVGYTKIRERHERDLHVAELCCRVICTGPGENRRFTLTHGAEMMTWSIDTVYKF